MPAGRGRKPGPLSAHMLPARRPDLTSRTQAAHGFADWGAVTLERGGPHAFGAEKSIALDIAELLAIKSHAHSSVALLRHYLKAGGESYDLGEIPAEWQDWIVKATKGKPGRYKDLFPFNTGPYDLRNSLGHFNVVVTEENGRTTYDIDDTYEFGFRRHDRKQQGRHGFPLAHSDVERIRKLLPDLTYWNPGGFTERWEIKTVNRETILYIPQQFLSNVGVPFKVHGRFQREQQRARATRAR